MVAPFPFRIELYNSNMLLKYKYMSTVVVFFSVQHSTSTKFPDLPKKKNSDVLFNLFRKRLNKPFEIQTNSLLNLDQLL